MSATPERKRSSELYRRACELMPDDLVERMSRSGTTACMQPNFVAQWGGRNGMYETAIGSQRWRLGRHSCPHCRSQPHCVVRGIIQPWRSEISSLR